MTRKDTILVSVIVNAGLLAVLFTTAVIYDADKIDETLEFVASSSGDNKSVSQAESLIASVSTGDEVDNVLKYYSQPIAVQNQSENYMTESLNIPSYSETEAETETSSKEPFVEVKVKKGDVLEKIAKAHKTTVAAIKRANHLESERLSIGQTLKIPIKDSQEPPIIKSTKSDSLAQTKPNFESESSSEPIYYTVKSGDNPWKIAKQFGVKYDEILKLNNLDEEKARNLKIGDRVRVK